MPKRIAPYRRLSIFVLAAAVMFAVPPPLHAFDIHGRVINGTTGKPLATATITVVNPRAGMVPVKEVQANDVSGRFTIEGLDETAPVHLLRVFYDGVSYTEIIQFDGNSPISLEMKVYETTSSWDGVQVAIPYLMATRSLDTLKVDRYIQISNNTSPPRTVTGDDARFSFYLPKDMIGVTALHVMSMGIPLPLEPQPTENPESYTVDYPIRPGITRVSISINVPYSDAHYHYREALAYDLAELTVVTEDPSLRVDSPTMTLEPVDDVEGLLGYRMNGLKRGTPLELTFSGGSETPVTPAATTVRPTVFVIPNQTNRMSLTLMVVVIVALLAMTAVVVFQPRSEGAERNVLLAQKGNLLDQIAKLDDLHKAGTVSERLYNLKRSELMNALAQIYYRTSFKRQTASKSPGKGRGTKRVG